MKKYLIPSCGKFYKANLHMHSTVSDGRMSPEEIKKAYKEKGYSIVAYTDHDWLVTHHELTDDSFLAITGVEIAFNDFTHNIGRAMKTYHVNLLAKTPDISVCPPAEYAYSQQAVNKFIERANKAGFLTSYNHPIYSMQNFSEYGELKGLWGVEVYNHIGAMDGLDENENAFSDLLRQNQKVVPLATDDSHFSHTCFGGWVMVKSEKLDYLSIMQALERGDMYSTTGPEIKELYFENGKVYVKTSPVKSIALVQERRHGKRHYANDGEFMTETVFDISEYLSENSTPNLPCVPYIRLIITDEKGNKAYTRAYFMEELE